MLKQKNETVGHIAKTITLMLMITLGVIMLGICITLSWNQLITIFKLPFEKQAIWDIVYLTITLYGIYAMMSGVQYLLWEMAGFNDEIHTD